MKSTKIILGAAIVASLALGGLSGPVSADPGKGANAAGGAGPKGAAAPPAKGPTATGGGQTGGPKLRSLGGDGPKAGSWTDDRGRVHEPNNELGTELHELGDTHNGGFPPLKDQDRIAKDIFRKLDVSTGEQIALAQEWARATTIDDKVRTVRHFIDKVKGKIKNSNDPKESEWYGREGLNTSLRRLQWLERNIGDANGGDSVIDSLQTSAAARAARQQAARAAATAQNAARRAGTQRHGPQRMPNYGAAQGSGQMHRIEAPRLVIETRPR